MNNMTMKSLRPFSRLTTLLCLVAGAFVGQAQNYAPTNWVNDPFCHNENFSLTGGDSASPTFFNNGEQRGTLYLNSPIGQTLTLSHPGEAISCTGQVVLDGDINADGNMQFRVGLFDKGSSTTDTNWLGYMFGNPTGAGGEAATGLYVRNNPNASVYSSGSPDNAKRPSCGKSAYAPGWAAATYDFSLTITQLPDQAQGIAWKLTGVAPNIYSYSGSYTNKVAATIPPAFNQVGILAGAALFNSASTDNSIGFKNVTVTIFKNHDAP